MVAGNTSKIVLSVSLILVYLGLPSKVSIQQIGMSGQKIIGFGIEIHVCCGTLNASDSHKSDICTLIPEVVNGVVYSTLNVFFHLYDLSPSE